MVFFHDFIISRMNHHCTRHTVQAHSPPVSAGRVSGADKVEGYCCCCGVTFQIASLFCFFPLQWRGGGGGGESEAAETFRWWKSWFFLLFFLPPLFPLSAVSLQISVGDAKKAIFSFPPLKSNSDITVLLHVVYLYVQLWKFTSKFHRYFWHFYRVQRYNMFLND